MILEPQSESYYLVRELERPAFEVASWIESQSFDGVLEAYAAYDSVSLHIDPSRFQPEDFPESATFENLALIASHHEIGVCYELGLDFQKSCDLLGISREDFIAIHSSAQYQVAAVGFLPGFPYLTGLPERLHGLPRLPSPRKEVPAGSVAITGKQTGIYPRKSPGGWNLIGVTEQCFSPADTGFSLVKAGDFVHFTPYSAIEFRTILLRTQSFENEYGRTTDSD